MRPQLSDYQHISAGKVRELYQIDSDTLLMVATDRISAYDWILSTPVPDTGRVLTAMSFHFFEMLDFPNHLAGGPEDERIPEEVLGRAMVCKKLDMVPVECVARGYLTGSGLIDYTATQSVCGVPLPAGLVESSQLPEPIFTPAAKAELGQHDENVTLAQVADMVEESLADKLKAATLQIYTQAATAAKERGIILADTKFEFGHDKDGVLVIGDEVLTPDSSRYWPADEYQPGRTQPSFDKQYVRDWLTSPASGWDRYSDTQPPALPADVIAATRARYIEAYEKISGKSFADWPGSAL